MKAKKGKEPKVSKTGLPHGSSVYIGLERSHIPVLKVVSYDLNSHEEYVLQHIKDLGQLNQNKFHWIHINGVHNVDTVHELCRLFNLQTLTEEDILNTHSRPKCELFDNYVFTELKIIKYESVNTAIDDEQMSLVLTKNVLITFQETDNHFFDPIFRRLSNPDSRARRKGVDFLYCLIMDLIVDNYIDTVEGLSHVVEDIENKIIQEDNKHVLTEIQSLKTDLLYLKKVIFPFKESILKILRSDSIFFNQANIIYFNDLYDHLLFVTDSIETQREIVVGLRDMYMSLLSIAMNNVMKILTIITSIFIPLSFIAGVYGMNFDVMPELRHKYGYYYVLGFMLLVALGMLYYFRRKKWM